jgi:hypothetical protein
VHNCASRPEPVYVLREHLTYSSDVKSITFLTLELVHQVDRFEVSKGIDGISQIAVRTSE